MQAPTLDRYSAGQSLLHRLEPRVKVLLTLLFVLSNALLPDGAWLAFAASWLAIIAASQLAQLGYGYTLKRSFVAVPFALAAVTAIFALPGEPLYTLRIGGWQLTATDVGVVRFASILMRSWLSVQMAILLTATTHFPDLMHALRHLRVPGVLVAIVSFMVRYLSVLTDEAVRLMRARQSRSGALSASGLRPGGSLTWRAQIAGHMAGQLFLRSYERSDHIYNAMLARGYQGHFLTLNPHLLARRDWWSLGLSLGLLVVIQLLGHLSL